MSGKLIDHLIQVQNLSGAIRNAPHSLKDLKGALDGVPFQLLSPGMSGVMNLQKIMQAVTQLAGQLGGLTNVGNFTNMLGQFQGLASSLQGIGQLNPNILASKLNLSQITAAMGNVGAFGAALTQFGSVANLQAINQLTGQPPGSNLQGVQGDQGAGTTPPAAVDPNQ